MQYITSTSELKNAIQLLEIEQADKGKILMEHFQLIYESFRPINILRKTLQNFSLSPYMVDTITGTGIGLIISFLTRNKGASIPGGLISKLLGSLMKYGASNVIAHNVGAIKSFGQIIFQKIFRKK